MDLPESVFSYIRNIFDFVDDEVSGKISLNPNIPEANLDICFIDSLSTYSAPRVVTAGWVVSISSHFIGNIRHYRRYEIADIGVVILYKRGARIQRRKLILLQSKRLYPLNNRVIELDDFDYERGLGLITRDETSEAPISALVDYEFNIECRYSALRKANEQCQSIIDHFQDTQIPVHYMMYNPVVMPWNIRYPVPAVMRALPARKFGTRIIEAEALYATLRRKQKGYSPKLRDLTRGPDNTYGDGLGSFFEEAVRCRCGYVFDGENEHGIRRLFSRKSGPIFCILEIKIEEID